MFKLFKVKLTIELILIYPKMVVNCFNWDMDRANIIRKPWYTCMP